MTKHRVSGILSAFIAVIIWASVFPIKEHLLKYLSPVSINFFNAFITTAVYLIYIILSKKSCKIGYSTALKQMLAGIIGISITRLACDIGINAVGGVTASVFISLIPIMCLLFDCLFFKKFPNKITLASILLSLIGIILVIGLGKNQQINVLGYFFLFISNCAWIFYCYVCNDPNKNHIPPSVSMFFQFLGSTIFLCPALLFTKTDYSVFLKTDIVFSILFLGIANGVIAYGLFVFSVKIIGVLFSNIINNFIPVVTLIIGICIFGEKVFLSQILGLVFIILSVICISLYQNTSV